MKAQKNELIDFVRVYEEDMFDVNPKEENGNSAGPRIKVDMKNLEKDSKASHISRVLKQFLITYLNAWYDLHFAKSYCTEEIESLKIGLEKSVTSLLSGLGEYTVKVKYAWINVPAYYTIIIDRKV